MSPPVSPCQWRYRGSGSTEPKGLAVSRKAALLRGWKSCDVDSFRTPPPAAPPLSALSRGRGGHCYASATLSRTLLRISHTLTENTPIRKYTGENIAALQPHTQTSQRVCQFHQLFYFLRCHCSTLNINRYRRMSPPVSPFQWRYRGSGSLASRRG